MLFFSHFYFLEAKMFCCVYPFDDVYKKIVVFWLHLRLGGEEGKVLNCPPPQEEKDKRFKKDLRGLTDVYCTKRILTDSKRSLP